MSKLKSVIFLVLFFVFVSCFANSSNEIKAEYEMPPGSSYLDGIFFAPPGTTVVLQKDGTDDLTLVAAAGVTAQFTQNPFKFPKLYTDGTPYTMSIKSAPADQTCRVEKGIRGTIGLSPGFARIGCDYTFELVSRSTDDTKFGTFYDSTIPVIGGDFLEEGRYVAFQSSGAGLGTSSGKKRQILWRDRNTGETKLVSVGMGGTEGNGDSFAPSISADGKSVAFESTATNLTENDANGVSDVFVWSATSGKVARVSTAAGGVQANAASSEPTISGDGSFIAFSSGASNLTPGVEGINTINVYLRDMRSGMTKLISADEKTKKGVGGSNPSISDDGSRLAFYSYAASLVADDKNNLWDIFLYDAGNPKLKRLSLTNDRTERNQGTESMSRVVAPAISGNGVFVAFATTATNVVSGDNNKLQDVFVVNADSGEVKRVSTGNNGIEGDGDSPAGQGEKVGISFDGSLVAFSTNATNLGGNIILKNVSSGENSVISTDGSRGVGRPSVSRSGGYVVFGSGSRLSSRFSSSGIFAKFTGITRCRFCSK
ncbi:MAG TPA: hypothetical protein VGC97_14935 [Pyrinomonadaceae bacterium]|jgi:Tol biopolymer transport system component